MSNIVNAAHNDGQNQVFSMLGVIGTLGTADVSGTALTLPIAVNERGAMYTSASELLPTEGNNPSLVVSYNASGDTIKLEKTIGAATYTKTISNADTTVASSKTISVWS